MTAEESPSNQTLRLSGTDPKSVSFCQSSAVMNQPLVIIARVVSNSMESISAAISGKTQGMGVGVTVGVGVGVIDGVTVGVGATEGVGDTDGVGVTEGVGVTLGVGVTVGVGVTEGVGVALGGAWA